MFTITSGWYTVSLAVKNAAGEQDVNTQKDWIKIDSKPIANFSVDKALICPGTTVNFNDMSSGEPKRWRWNFGDGWVSNKQNPTHTYKDPGTYMVRLISSSACGYSLEQKTKYIAVRSPAVDFETSQGGDCDHLSVAFTGKSATGESLSNCKWNFGRGIGRDRGKRRRGDGEDGGVYLSQTGEIQR